MWKVVNAHAPDLMAWNGDFFGPSTAAQLENGTVVASTRVGERQIFNTVAEAKLEFADDPPDVCLDELLAIQLNCPLVYGESCPLFDVCYYALGTGIASPYNLAHILKLMITGRRCKVRIRRIFAGQPHALRAIVEARAHGNQGTPGVEGGSSQRNP